MAIGIGPMFPRLTPMSTRGAGETLTQSPVSRNNPFATSRVGDYEASEGLQNVLMKLAVLEHQQNTFDAKLMEMEAYVKSSLTARPTAPVLLNRDDVSAQLCGQLLELKQELRLASKEDDASRAELQKQIVEGQRALRRELFDVIKTCKLDKLDLPGQVRQLSQETQAEGVAATQAEVAHVTRQLRQEVKQEERDAKDQEVRDAIIKITHDLSELRSQIAAPAEIQKAFEEKVSGLNQEITLRNKTMEEEMIMRSKTMEEVFEEKLSGLNDEMALRNNTMEEALQSLEQATQKFAAQENLETLATEMKTRSVELEQAFESKLTLQKQVWDRSLRQQGEEFDGRLTYESKSLRQELDVNSESLRLELQTCLEHKISDEVSRPMEQIRQELLQLKDHNDRCFAVMEEQEGRQVAVRSDLDRLRQDVSSNSGKLVQLSDLKLQTEDQVRGHISELLIKAKADFQEQLQPFSPIERRLEQLTSEVARYHAMGDRAREELGGLLRVEMQAVAAEAMSRQKKLVDQELRSLLDRQHRQFTEALEAAASRASCELKELSAGHATEVRALSLRLTDAEHFSQQVSFAVREMQKHRVKALENGTKKAESLEDRGPEKADRDRGAGGTSGLLQLQQEMHGFARYTEAKTKELYQVLTELKATCSEHERRLSDLTQEALVTNQRLDTTLFTLERRKASKAEELEVPTDDSSPHWAEAVREMENLTDIVGSLEREGPASPASVTAVRRELQAELKEVWRALSEIQSVTRGPTDRPGGESSTPQPKAKMTPKAHPAPPERSKKVSLPSESYSDYSSEEESGGKK